MKNTTVFCKAAYELMCLFNFSANSHKITYQHFKSSLIEISVEYKLKT